MSHTILHPETVRGPGAARLPSLLCLAVSLLFTAGCSPSPYDANVSGTVTLDGEEIGPGTVAFVSSDKKANPATGAIQLDGGYTLLTKKVRGIDSGVYKVSVKVFEKVPPLAPGERLTTAREAIVPKKYLSATTSGLSFEVQPGSQTIDIALTSE